MQLKTDDHDDMDETSTVKLQVPKHQHVRLHCLKIMTGRTMSEIATEALTRYFEEEGVGDDIEFDEDLGPS